MVRKMMASGEWRMGGSSGGLRQVGVSRTSRACSADSKIHETTDIGLSEVLEEVWRWDMSDIEAP